MKSTQADQYFLKALDNYGYDMNETLESLEYALSYDDIHAASNCLMGCVQMFWIKNFKTAAHSFELALIGDKEYVDTYKYFSLLMIWTGNFERAEKLIIDGMKLKGMDKAILLSRKAMMYECNGRYKEAKQILKMAYHLSFNDSYTNFFDQELLRIKKKIKMRQKMEKSDTL
jgi:tetratricopeptide (TPR) repeat protein